ncbi:MAG: site-2 protease family protein [Halobacteriota archaeon]|nr:site-2 protease family protein [Halobacteriota archaeon]
MNYYIITLLIFVVYWALVTALDNKSILDKYNIKAYGPMLMIRTQRGQNLLSWAARAKRFWRIFADIGIPLMVISMVLMFVMVLLADYLMLFHTPPPSEVTSPRAALLIPGINPFVPLVWGLIGLIVTIIVHELAHGILCKVEGIKVRSMGIILALIPIGAFAEPDEFQLFGLKKEDVPNEQNEEEEQLKIATRGERVRVLAAGVMSNFVVAFIAFLIFFSLLYSIAPIAEGVTVVNVSDGYPAKEAGIKEGMILTSINETRVKTIKDFIDVMGKTKPGQVIEVGVYTGESFEITLAEEENYTTGFMGVTFESGPGEFLTFLQDLPKSVGGIFALLGLPFLPFAGFDRSISTLYEPIGWAMHFGDVIFWTINFTFWVAWINMWAGIFNSLPAVPLDGGHVFREIANSVIEIFTTDEERRDRISNMMVNLLAIAIFSSFLFMFIAPYLVHGF